MSTSQLPTRTATKPRGETITRPPAMLAAGVLVALGMAASTAYALLSAEPYRSLPDSTVLAARGQDVASLFVGALLVALLRPALITPLRLLATIGLMAYVAYSYAIYLVGVPMNRIFLVYVVIECVAAAALIGGLWQVATLRWPSVASTRLVRGTGWMLVVVAVMFAGLWLSTLLPFALGGNPPDPQGVGGTPYPVFVLDLVVVLPSVAAIGLLLLRGHRLGAPLAVIALIKILSLFTALWAGPAYALATDGPVHLGPDAGPSLLLLVVSAWLITAWWRALTTDDNEKDGVR